MTYLPLLPGITGALYWSGAYTALVMQGGPWHAFFTLRRAAVTLRDEGAQERARMAAAVSRRAYTTARRQAASSLARGAAIEEFSV